MKRVGLGLLAAAMWAQPIHLHPENPHYFLYAGRPTVLITSGEHYGAVLNSEFDFKRYLDTLAADGLNLTRVFSGAYREAPGNFKIASNTLAPAPGRYLAPWAQQDGKFDLTRWDDRYFARLKEFLGYARGKGVVVEYVLFCPFYEDSMWEISPMNARNNVNGIGNVARTDVLALKDTRLTEVQDALVRKVARELRGFDNLYYEICNEPYFGGVTLEWQAHIAEALFDAENGAPQPHLIAQNWANGSKLVDHPNPLVGLFSFHYSRPPDSVAMNWHLERAIGNNETGFDGPADSTYRVQGWDFLMAGGALYNNLDYSFTVGREDGKFQPPASTPGGGGPELRRQLAILRKFMDEIPFWQMQPAPKERVRAPEGVAVRALEFSGKVYALYLHPSAKNAAPASRQIQFDLPPGDYRVTWRDPKNGRDVKTESFTAPGALESPVLAEDLAAIVRH